MSWRAFNGEDTGNLRGVMSRFAQHTTVSPEKSRSEIEALLRRYGADQFSSGWKEGEARVQFRAHGRYVRFVLPLPNPKDDRFRHTARGRWRHPGKRADVLAGKDYEQTVRQRWRALALVVKAKLEAVETGITAFEEEFLAHIILPDGKTVGDHALPAVAEAYGNGKMPALLPGW